MECPKCKKELDEDIKFCGECGEKVEKIHTDFNQLYLEASAVWFMIGRNVGLFGEDKKGLKKYEELLKEEMPAYEQYCEVMEIVKKTELNSKLNLFGGENVQVPKKGLKEGANKTVSSAHK